MSDSVTKRMLAAYTKRAKAARYFTGMFQAPPRNFHNSEEVEIDIEREDEEIAIVITDLTTGYHMNSADLYTNKKFKPPLFKEAFPINAFDTIKRQPGKNPFDDPTFQATASVQAFNQFRRLENKIRRAIELQGSQILRTGTVTLNDEDGNPRYVINFLPKSTHFPTAAVDWDAVGADIAGDLGALCGVIRDDGLEEPDEISMGELDYETAMANADFLARFNTLRADLGTISPMNRRGNGGLFRGVVEIGNYKLDVFTYNGRYIDPETRVKTRYLPNGSVIVRTTGARLDATFGAIPRIMGPERRALPFIPPRISNSGGRVDLQTNAWVTPDGEQLFGSVGTRPLLIPTDIDSFGCLTTGLA